MASTVDDPDWMENFNWLSFCAHDENGFVGNTGPLFTDVGPRTNRVELPTLPGHQPVATWTEGDLGVWLDPCIARFAVKDGADVEVEWASLPDSHAELARAEAVTGDLPPGDLPAWIPHNDEDTPGPIGQPIPPDRWIAPELQRVVASEVAHRQGPGVQCGMLADVLGKRGLARPLVE